MIVKKISWFVEDLIWSIRCTYGFWLHGPYGLAKVVEKIPFRFLVNYLRKYGATIGTECRFERGLNLHRPLGKKPFENLVIGNGVYLGHDTLIDLSRKVTIEDKVIIASRCQIWTHASYYDTISLNNPKYGEHYGEVCIGEYAILYSNVLVTHGTTIGKFARVGACSLVNKSVPNYSFVGGVPIKEIATIKSTNHF